MRAAARGIALPSVPAPFVWPRESGVGDDTGNTKRAARRVDPQKAPAPVAGAQALLNLLAQARVAFDVLKSDSSREDKLLAFATIESLRASPMLDWELWRLEAARTKLGAREVIVPIQFSVY